jgi:2-oxoglutarate ferredoxin oxidoreductase subunit gamma
METTEIRISGFGGQGVILAAYVIGKATAVMEGRHATLNQSFGPEARGSACSAQLILSDEPIAYPYVRRADILVAMSQDALRQFIGEVRDGGMVLFDDSLVAGRADPRIRMLGAPASRCAEQLGKRIVGNMVMVGLFTATTEIVSVEAIQEAVRTSVPTGSEKLNLSALERGLELGRALVSKRNPEEVIA